MSTARDLKRRADTLLEELVRSIFEEIDTEKLRRDVEALKESSPGYTSAEHARTLTRRTAIRCAASGAVTGLPSGIAFLGTLSADLAYLMYQQFRLILGIATIYGHEPSSRDRITEALSCLALTTGVGVGKQGLARLTKVVPLAGVVTGGALNYVSVHAVARNAIRYYESRIDQHLADEIWAEGDREHA
jgi:uncharacterized protein (DUF697 family)